MTPLNQLLRSLHTEIFSHKPHRCFCDRQHTSSGICHVCRVEELISRVGQEKASRYYAALRELERSTASILEERAGLAGQEVEESPACLFAGR